MIDSQELSRALLHTCTGGSVTGSDRVITSVSFRPEYLPVCHTPAAFNLTSQPKGVASAKKKKNSGKKTYFLFSSLKMLVAPSSPKINSFCLVAGNEWQLGGVSKECSLCVKCRNFSFEMQFNRLYCQGAISFCWCGNFLKFDPAAADSC